MTALHLVKPPKHFYTPTAWNRWRDPYADPSGESRMVLLPQEVIAKGRRDEAYIAWLRRHRLPQRNCLFQAVRIHNHRVSGVTNPWWERYTECWFRCFVQPLTQYAKAIKAHRQWYILCPEDSEMTLRWEWEQKGAFLPPRNPITEKYFSLDKRLNKVRLVPVEVCRHMRHEGKGVVDELVL